MRTDAWGNRIEDGGSGIVVNIRSGIDGCSVNVGAGCDLQGLRLHLYVSGATVSIGSGNTIRGDIYIKVQGGTVTIGNRNSIRNNIFMNVGGPVTIGHDCLFAAVKFRSTDSHRIFDMKSDERVNPDAPISVGNHVWMAEEALLLGGATIGDGSVIGARSLVTGQVPPNSLAVGSPARVVRSGIRWEE